LACDTNAHCGASPFPHPPLKTPLTTTTGPQFLRWVGWFGPRALLLAYPVFAVPFFFTPARCATSSESCLKAPPFLPVIKFCGCLPPWQWDFLVSGPKTLPQKLLTCRPLKNHEFPTSPTPGDHRALIFSRFFFFFSPGFFLQAPPSFLWQKLFQWLYRLV